MPGVVNPRCYRYNEIILKSGVYGFVDRGIYNVGGMGDVHDHTPKIPCSFGIHSIFVVVIGIADLVSIVFVGDAHGEEVGRTHIDTLLGVPTIDIG